MGVVRGKDNWPRVLKKLTALQLWSSEGSIYHVNGLDATKSSAWSQYINGIIMVTTVIISVLAPQCPTIHLRVYY